MDLMDKDLSLNYLSHCDPRLNYEQSLGKYPRCRTSLRWRLNEPVSPAFQMLRSSLPITYERRGGVRSRRMSYWRNSDEGGRIQGDSWVVFRAEGPYTYHTF